MNQAASAAHCYLAMRSSLGPIAGPTFLMGDSDDFDSIVKFSVNEKKRKPREYVTPGIAS